MVAYSRVVSIITFISLFLATSLYAQIEKSAIDSTFEAYHTEVWDKIEKSEFNDSLQNHYSEKFFDYYKSHNGTKSAERAFSSAFLMWGNTGNNKYIDEALATLDDDLELWGKVIRPLSNIYHRNENLVYDNYINYLHELKNRITDPVSKSQLLSMLVRHYKDHDKNDKVRAYAQKMVELDADKFFVDFALKQLHELESLQIGQEAPPFASQTISGNSLSLSDLNGEFVLLEFWGTWCGPCKPEIPHLKTLKEKHGDVNLKIVGIALDEDENVAREFTRENEMEWPQILQKERWRGEIVNSYSVLSVPRMYLIGPDGYIVAKDLRGDKMVNKVDQMITEYYEE